MSRNTISILIYHFHKLLDLMYISKKKLNSIALVRKRTILTERPPLAGEVSVNFFLWIEGVAWSAQLIPTAVNLAFLNPEPLLFHSSSSLVILTRLSGPRYRLITSQKIW
jgi:hypothetical protein